MKRILKRIGFVFVLNDLRSKADNIVVVHYVNMSSVCLSITLNYLTYYIQLKVGKRSNCKSKEMGKDRFGHLVIIVSQTETAFVNTKFGEWEMEGLFFRGA